MPSDESVNERVSGVRRAFGPYRLERIISEGATGIVLEAVHRILDRRVALKTLNPRGFERSGLTVSELSELFLHEARVLATVDHPNVLPILEANWARGHGIDIEIPYLALRLMPLDLITQVARHGPFAGEAAVRLACDCAAGLVATHVAGWLHRDLKPGNILLESDLRARLSDYSAAIRRDDAAPPALVGTAGYLAPELLAGGPPDERTDVYALGATLFFAVHRDAPSAWPGEAFDDWERRGRRPDGSSDGIPAGLRAIIVHALRPDPTERYNGSADLLADCRRVAAGEAPTHPPRQRRRLTGLFAIS